VRWRRTPTGQTAQGLTPEGGLSHGSPEWEYVPEGWSQPARGWDAEAVADAYARKWPDYLQAIRAQSRSASTTRRRRC
jgi:hypothetical protein